MKKGNKLIGRHDKKKGKTEDFNRQDLPWRNDLLWPFVIFLASVLTFAPALRNLYCLDDIEQVRNFKIPQGLDGWAHAFATKWWPDSVHYHLWRPLTRLSILAQKAVIQRTIGSSISWPFYAFNILLHAAVGVLLYRVARRLSFGRAAAGLGAVIFAVHPIHSEAVHQIVGRAELFDAFWMLVGLAALLHWGLRDWRNWLIQPLVYALALGAKENGVLYPAIVLLAVCAMDGLESLQKAGAATQAQWRRFPALLRERCLWRLMVLFSFVLGLYFIAKFLCTGGILDRWVIYYENPLILFSFWQRLPAGLGLLGYVASRLVWPLGLSPDYTAISFPFARGWGWGWSWVGLVVLVATLLLMARDARRGGRGWALAAAALITYGFISNLPFTIGTIGAQRLWYLPSAPACLGMGWVIGRSYHRFAVPWRRLTALALAGVILGCVAISWRDASQWRSPDDFTRSLLAHFPLSHRGIQNMASHCFNDGQFPAGYDYALKLTNLFPEDADGWNLRGALALNVPQHSGEAEDDFRKAIALDPTLGRCRGNYAYLLEQQGRFAEAVPQWEAYLKGSDVKNRETIEKHLEEIKKSPAAIKGNR